jgi:hypothetical protein
MVAEAATGKSKIHQLQAEARAAAKGKKEEIHTKIAQKADILPKPETEGNQ